MHKGSFVHVCLSVCLCVCVCVCVCAFLCVCISLSLCSLVLPGSRLRSSIMARRRSDVEMRSSPKYRATITSAMNWLVYACKKGTNTAIQGRKRMSKPMVRPHPTTLAHTHTHRYSHTHTHSLCLRLCAACLGGRNADFRPCIDVDAARGFAGNGRADSVSDTHTQCAALLAVAQCIECVGRLACPHPVPPPFRRTNQCKV
jgi:hypothetical protein